MKRNSQQYVEQAAGHAAGVRLTARHTAAGSDAAGHAASAYPPPSARPSYAVGGKENSYRWEAAPGSKPAPLQSPRYGSNLGSSLAPPRSPRYGGSLGSNLAATSQQQPPPGHGNDLNHNLIHNLAARRAAPPPGAPSGAPPSGFVSARGGLIGPCERACPLRLRPGRPASMLSAHKTGRLAGTAVGSPEPILTMALLLLWLTYYRHRPQRAGAWGGAAAADRQVGDR